MISAAGRSTHHARARRFARLIALCAVASAVACGSAGAAFPPGSVLAFGNNQYGALGSSLNLGTAKANPTPAMIVLPGATGNVTDAATGDGYSLVLTGTGQVYSFGVNTYGQLGTSTNLGTQNPNPTPALVTFPGLGGQVSSVAGDGNSSLALTSTGQVYGFGSDAEGELGTPPVSGSHNEQPTPTLISLPGVQGQAVQIATGVYHSLVLSSAGQLYTFGWNALGQLGRATPSNNQDPTPTPVSLPGIHGQVIQIAAGQNDSVALTSTGQVYAWGDNFYGQLGNPTNNGKAMSNATPTLVTFPGLSGLVTQIAAGGTHTLALTSAGQLYAFGSNNSGEIGTTSGLGPSTANPVPTLVPIPAAAGKIVQIAAHLDSSLLVTATGQLYTFGNNAAGQLGYPTNSGPNPTPALVELPGTPISAVGVGGFTTHSLAIVGVPPIGTRVTLTSSADPSVAGQRLTYTATVTPAPTGGTVGFTDRGRPITGCAAIRLTRLGAASDVARCSATYASASIHPIEAIYTGAGNYLGSQSATLKQTVQAKPAIGHVMVKGRRVSIRLRCLGATGSCTVTIALTLIETVRSGTVIAVSARSKSGATRRKTLVLDRVTVRLAAGRHRTVTLNLNAAGRRLLARYHRLKVALTITQPNGAKHRTISSRRITFAQPK